MSREKGKELKINKVLASMGVVCSILAITIIALPNLNKAKIETLANSSKQMEHNYATTTESNTWDISKNGDGSVIATLDANELLTIAGSGEMIGWSSSSSIPWYSVRNQIKNVKIENGVTSIGRRAFQYCSSLTSIEIPDSVTSIGNSAFFDCESLTSIEIPESVRSIGDSAFQHCSSLTSIVIPEGVTNIEIWAFGDCTSLTSIEVPASVTSIEISAFASCTNLTSIEIPGSVTSIGGSAFYDCKSLTSIEIPSSVISIGDGAFRGCESLINIEVDENNEKYCDENGVLYTKDKKEIRQYPAGKVEKVYTILNGVTSIGSCAFEGCKSLKNIEIPTSVPSIGTGAFSSCTSLTNIKIRSTQSKNTVDKIENMNNSYEIMDKEGNAISDKTENVKTGNRLKLDNDKICTIIVTGDSNGDGETNMKDILSINKHRLNKANLVDEYLLASDVNKDGIVDIKDILQINKFRLGKITEI